MGYGKKRDLFMRINPFRNNDCLNKNKFCKHRVNIEDWRTIANLGDSLSSVVVEWMLEQKGYSLNDRMWKTKHLYAIGSVLGEGYFDAVVWGSGIHNYWLKTHLKNTCKYRKMDIRAVRGPRTKSFLEECGYTCPEIYGDPAIIMPLIFKPNVEKEYDVSLIHHYTKKGDIDDSVHEINIETTDYIYFITEIVKSKRVISSSLHGIILAETYGVPAVFLNEGMDEELTKYYDWYESTQRFDVRYARDIEEAKRMEPMELPNLINMRNALINAFPYSMWEHKWKN